MCRRVKKVRRVKAEARQRTDHSRPSCDFTRHSLPITFHLIMLITYQSKQSWCGDMDGGTSAIVASAKAVEDSSVVQDRGYPGLAHLPDLVTGSRL